jgi:hypothetical protein
LTGRRRRYRRQAERQARRSEQLRRSPIHAVNLPYNFF